MKEMSLEQRVVVIWCPNMTSEREKEDICWEHFFWMHENDTAKDSENIDNSSDDNSILKK